MPTLTDNDFMPKAANLQTPLTDADFSGQPTLTDSDFQQKVTPSSFDPEGEGYDMESALKAGIQPQINPEDGLPHWQSREPKTGLLLKGKKHKTWNLLEEGEKKAGYEIYKGEDGRYYSKQKKQTLTDVDFETPPVTPTPDITQQPATATPPPPSSTLRRAVGDPLLDLAQGLIAVPQSVVGLADVVSGGYAGKAVEQAVDLKGASNWWNDLKSVEAKEAQKKVASAKGFVSKLQTTIENPSVIASGIIQSLPAVAAGGGIARGVVKILPGLAKVAMGIGEGAITTGQIAEQIRAESEKGTLTPKQAILATGAGLATGIIGVLGGKLAAKLGIDDIDSLASGMTPTGEKVGIMRRIIGGFVSEGLFEELPQSMQEQIAQNIAQNKPWDDGVADSAVQGLITGGIMGAGVNIMNRGAAAPVEAPPPEVTPQTELTPIEQNALNAFEAEHQRSVMAGLTPEEAVLNAERVYNEALTPPATETPQIPLQNAVLPVESTIPPVPPVQVPSEANVPATPSVLTPEPVLDAPPAPVPPVQAVPVPEPAPVAPAPVQAPPVQSVAPVPVQEPILPQPPAGTSPAQINEAVKAPTEPTPAGVGAKTEGTHPNKIKGEKQAIAVQLSQIGTGNYDIGEVYSQNVEGGKRPVLITEKLPNGTVRGFYVGSVFGEMPQKSLQPAEFKNPAQELNIASFDATAWNKYKQQWTQPTPQGTPTPAAVEAKEKLTVLSNGKPIGTVDSFQEASEKWSKARDVTGVGGSESGLIELADNAGKIVGHVAYNGRVFEGPAIYSSKKTKPRLLYEAQPESPFKVPMVPEAEHVFKGTQAQRPETQIPAGQKPVEAGTISEKPVKQGEENVLNRNEERKGTDETDTLSRRSGRTFERFRQKISRLARSGKLEGSVASYFGQMGFGKQAFVREVEKRTARQGSNHGVEVIPVDNATQAEYLPDYKIILMPSHYDDALFESSFNHELTHHLVATKNKSAIKLLNLINKEGKELTDYFQRLTNTHPEDIVQWRREARSKGVKPDQYVLDQIAEELLAERMAGTYGNEIFTDATKAEKLINEIQGEQNAIQESKPKVVPVQPTPESSKEVGGGIPEPTQPAETRPAVAGVGVPETKQAGVGTTPATEAGKAKTAGLDVNKKKMAGTNAPGKTAVVKGRLTKLAKKLKNAIIEIFRTPEDLVAAHPEFKNDVDESVEGFHYKGVSYLVASNIEQGQEARVVAHEAVVHGGLRAILGEDGLVKVLQNTYLNNKKYNALVKAKLERGDVRSEIEAVEEVLADIWSQRQANPSLWNRLVARLRAGLRKAGFNVEWSEKDIEDLIAKAKRTVEGEPTIEKKSTAKFAQASKKETSAIAAAVLEHGGIRPYNKWIVDRNGKKHRYMGEEYKSIPLKFKRKNGKTLDTMLQALQLDGVMPTTATESDLIKALTGSKKFVSENQHYEAKYMAEQDWLKTGSEEISTASFKTGDTFSVQGKLGKILDKVDEMLWTDIAGDEQWIDSNKEKTLRIDKDSLGKLILYSKKAKPFSLESVTPEQQKTEAERAATKAKIAEKAAKPLKGTAGDLTADLFGQGETPLFDERRDVEKKQGLLFSKKGSTNERDIETIRERKSITRDLRTTLREKFRLAASNPANRKWLQGYEFSDEAAGTETYNKIRVWFDQLGKDVIPVKGGQSFYDKDKTIFLRTDQAPVEIIASAKHELSHVMYENKDAVAQGLNKLVNRKGLNALLERYQKNAPDTLREIQREAQDKADQNGTTFDDELNNILKDEATAYYLSGRPDFTDSFFSNPKKAKGLKDQFLKSLKSKEDMRFSRKPTSIKNAYNINEHEPVTKSDEEVMDVAASMISEDPEIGQRILEREATNPAPGGLSVEEEAVLLHLKNTRNIELQKATDNARRIKKTGTKTEYKDALAVLDQAKAKMNELDLVTHASGTRTAQSLRFRQRMIMEDYTLEAMIRREEASQDGEPLTYRQIAEIKLLQEQLSKAKATINELEMKNKIAEESGTPEGASEAWLDLVSSFFDTRGRFKKYTKESVHKIDMEGSKAETILKYLLQKEADGKKFSKKETEKVDPLISALSMVIAKRLAHGAISPKSLREELAKKYGDGIIPKFEMAYKKAILFAHENLIEEPEAKKVKELPKEKEPVSEEPESFEDTVKRMIREEAESGTKTLDEAVTNVHKILSAENSELTETEVRDAFTDYGKVKPATKDELKSLLSNWRTIGQLISSLERVQNNLAPLKTGQQRQKLSQEARELRRKLHKEMKKAGITITDPETQQKSAMETIKTRLKNQIEDLEKAIATKTKMVSNKGAVEYDAEAKALVAKRDALKETYVEIFPEEKTPKTNAERLAEAKTKIRDRMDNIRDQILDKERDLNERAKPLKTDQEYMRLREEESSLEELLDKYLPKTDQYADAKQAKQAEERLTKEIMDLNEQINKGERKRRMFTKKIETPKIATMKAIRDARKETLDTLFPNLLTDEQRIEKAVEAQERLLERAEADLARAEKGDFAKPAKPGTSVDQRIDEARNDVKDIRSEIKHLKDVSGETAKLDLARYRKLLERKTKEIQKRIARGDFTKKAKTEKVLDEETYQAKFAYEKVKDEWETRQYKLELANAPWTDKALRMLAAPFRVQRQILTSYDVSAFGRQGWFIALAHPIMGVKALKPMFRAMRSAEAMSRIQQDIEARENYKKGLYKKAKLFLAPWSNTAKMTAMEENFGGLPKALANAPGIGGSQRAYTTYLNVLRVNAFDALMSSSADPMDVNQDKIEAIADYINIATGRGNMGRFSNAAEALSQVLWSPRLLISRIQLLAGKPMYKGTAETKLMVAKEYARFLTGMAILYVLAKAAGGKLDLEDPKSTNFGKIQFGNTHIDPLAGLAQVTTLTARTVTGKKTTSTGKTIPIVGKKARPGQDWMNVIGDFFRSKASPLVGTMINLRMGETMVGEKVTSKKVLQDMLQPLSTRDIFDIMKEHGVPRGTALTVLGMLGMGVNNYKTGIERKLEQRKEKEEERAKAQRSIT